jgi:hypothetical protein
MLYADKHALRTRLKVSLLVIRQRELEFYTTNCIAIGTNALFLASFAWWGLTEPPFDEQGNDVVQTVYLVLTAMIMALELLATITSTLVSILGPALAIRGPDGAMHTAVDSMVTHYRFTFVCFALGLVFFHLSAISFIHMSHARGASRLRSRPLSRQRVPFYQLRPCTERPLLLWPAPHRYRRPYVRRRAHRHRLHDDEQLAHLQPAQAAGADHGHR